VAPYGSLPDLIELPVTGKLLSGNMKVSFYQRYRLVLMRVLLLLLRRGMMAPSLQTLLRFKRGSCSCAILPHNR